MIKIQIQDVSDFKDAYLKLIKPLVLDELKLLKLSLEHLQNHTSIIPANIVSTKTITKSIANIIREPNVPKGYFNKPAYVNGVQNYLVGAKKINTVNLPNLSRLVNTLLDTTNDKLESLLIGEPENLKDTSDNLLSNYNLINKGELDVLKLAFDYLGDIGKSVRRFFYDKNITTYCPYCNQVIARHTENAQTGITADQMNLDHFFDKDKNPLLALSLFNLVPSDMICNMTNKGSITFSNKYHLNPYISGFRRSMIFKPIYDPLSLNITKIDLFITVDRNSAEHLKLIGDADRIDDKPEQGNLNVFQIFTKYNRTDVLDRSNRILRKIHNTAINQQSLNDILHETGLIDSYENFKQWYEDTTLSNFHEKEFDKQPYSKLNRDILDFVINNSSNAFNSEMRKMIVDSYLPENGGE